MRTRSTIVERYQKRGRDYVVNETDLMDAADGRLLVRGRTHQSFLPPKAKGAAAAFVVDRATAQQKEQERAAASRSRPRTGPELGAVQKKVDQRRCWMFSGPARTTHTDAEQARSSASRTSWCRG